MGTLDRLHLPLPGLSLPAQLTRRTPWRPAPPDRVSALLTDLFGARSVDPAAIAPDLLARWPVARLQDLLEHIRERHGVLRTVKRRQGLHLLVLAHGQELVYARADPAGRLATLVTGPAALFARTAQPGCQTD